MSGVAASSTSDPRRALALLAVLGGCGPGIRQADDGSGSGEQETSAGEAGTNSAEGSSAAASSTGTGEVACPEGEYCFERFDLREIGSPSQLAAGNLDDEPGFEVCGQSRPFNPATGSLPPEAWAIDWVDGGPRVLFPSGAGAGHVGAPRFVAPSPLDGVRQCFTPGGAHVIEDGALVTREHPRPPIDGLPPMTVGYSGPVDVDGDGRHEMILYEESTNWYGYTGHLIRYEAEQTFVFGLPLPADKSWNNQEPKDLAIAAADFDGDGRDEIVVFHDLDTTIGAPSTYDPALNHVVTLRIIGDGEGYEELWRAPAGTYATRGSSWPTSTTMAVTTC